jgi:tetratricopeptide (TPR) repeat protein
MSRWVVALLLACGVTAFAGDLKKERPKPAPSQKEEVPPEEDESLAVDKYAFNPLKADESVRIGSYYFKKGRYRAAAQRFLDATRWNAGNANAWLRLGEAREKLKDPNAAREAYEKYIAAAPDAKNVPEIRKKLEKLK